ncbi:hypothetical protein [Psychrilyobacter sp.]|uniref:hypothetical protein n=1 Tax=Psychrilyobacter sp. TaxID=2586924 RepID=UPI003015CE6C
MNKVGKEIFLNNLFRVGSLKRLGLDYIAIYDNKQNEFINYSFPETNIKNVISLKGKKKKLAISQMVEIDPKQSLDIWI